MSSRYEIEEIEESRLASPRYEIEETEEPKKESLQDVFKAMIRENAKQALGSALGHVGKGFEKSLRLPNAEEALEKAGYGVMPFAQELPQGFLEGIEKSKAGVLGQDFNQEPLSPEYGAGFGRSVGQELSRGIITAPAIAGATLAGGPLGGIAATGLAYGATTPGNWLDRLIEGTSAAAIPAAGTAAHVGYNALKQLPGQLKHIKQLWNYPKNAKAISNAENELQKAADIEKGLKEESLLNYKTQSHPTLARKARENKSALERLITERQQLSPTDRDIKRILPGASGEELVPRANQTFKEAESLLADETKAIKSYIGAGLSHDVRLAKGVNEAIEATKGDIQNKFYLKLDKNLEDKNIVIPRTKELNKAELDAIEQIKGMNLEAKAEAEALKQYKGASNASDIIPAKDVVSQWRTIRDLAHEARLNSRKPGILAEDRKLWEQKALQLSETEKNLDTIIKNNIGDDYKLLKEGNARWSREVAPLYKNPLYWEIKNKGRINGDIIDKLRGTESGQDVLRQIIKDDPELLKHTLGQRYAKAPEKLHQFDEEAEQYINELPSLAGMRERHKAATEGLAKSKEGIGYAQARTKEIKKEADRIEKSFAEMKGSAERRQALDEQIPELKRLITEQEEMAKRLRKAADQKDINLRRKIMLEQQHKEARANLMALGKTLSKLAGSTGTAYAVGKKIGSH